MYNDGVFRMSFRTDFSVYTDKELVDMTINQNNEEAVYYLVYDRYFNDMVYLCLHFYKSAKMIEDLLGFLMPRLKGSSKDWSPLRNFGWRSSFRTWLSTVASNLFMEKRKELIGLGDSSVSIDIDEEGRPNVQLPDPSALNEKSQNCVIMMEAISRLENPMHQYVLYKELEGYSPKEIAQMLNDLAAADCNKSVEYTPGYVYNAKHRALEAVKEIVEQIKKEWYGDKDK